METIAQRVRRFSETSPDRVFCTFLSGRREERITFRDLYRRSAAYAREYRRAGVRENDLVLVILQHSPHLFYSYVGAILAGAIPSFMPFPSAKQRPEFYWSDHQKLFDRIAPRLIVTYEKNLESARASLPEFSIPVLIAGDSIFDTPESDVEDLPGFQRTAGDVACLQHSSGTTSLKKGVMLTHRAILTHVDAYARALDFGPDDSIASWLPLYHDMGFVACFMASLLQGTHLIAMDPFEWVMKPSILLDAIEKYRATFCWLPNFAFSHLVNTAKPSAQWDLSSIRAFINCSEPCKSHTFERFAERFGACGAGPEKLQVCYAMAENVFGVTQTPIGGVARIARAEAEAFSTGSVKIALLGESSVAVLSCGKPIDGVSVEIKDSEGRSLEDGRIGEIYLTSPFVFEGYYRLPEKTAERLSGGWYRSGDMGFMLNGELYVTGRMDDMLIVNGRNYYAHEIESIVNGVKYVLPGRNVAIGVEDALTDATGVIVLAECSPDADVAHLGQEIRRRVLETLGLAIHSVFPLSAGQLVKTTSGKISRVKNKELYVQGGF